MKKFWKKISELVWPHFDFVNGVPGQYLSKADLSRCLVGESFCVLCGVPFADKFLEDVVSKHPCGRCLTAPPGYDGHRAIFVYDGVVRDLVHRFKYHADFWVRRFALDHMERWRKDFSAVDLIVPVPLHRKKLAKRGYNQSLLLAKMWQKILQKPIGAQVLERVIDTPSQTNFTAGERQKNLKNVFNVIQPEIVWRKNVLVVDDVHTTGATLNEISWLLKENGSGKVLATTLALVQ